MIVGLVGSSITIKDFFNILKNVAISRINAEIGNLTEDIEGMQFSLNMWEGYVAGIENEEVKAMYQRNVISSIKSTISEAEEAVKILELSKKEIENMVVE